MVLPLWRRMALALCTLALLGACAQGAAAPDAARFIVKLRGVDEASGAQAVAALAARTQTRVNYIRSLSGGAHLVAIPSAHISTDLARLRADTAVEYIEPDRRYQHQ